jgi:hypothetical protein
LTPISAAACLVRIGYLLLAMIVLREVPALAAGTDATTPHRRR